MIAKEKIQETLFAADIKTVIEERGIQLKKAGTVLYKGKCPFHNEQDASFFVNKKTQHYTCFGCEKHGNAIDFLMEKDGMTFVETVRTLASRFGVILEEYTPSPEEEKREREVTVQKTILEEATNFYHKQLFENKQALEYALGRFKKESLEEFRIGYAPNDFSALYTYLRNKGFRIEALEQSDLFRHKKDGQLYDFFRDRLMFPIFDALGKVCAFSGRTLQQETNAPKYINSSESLTYSKGKSLFGYHIAFRHIRKADLAILVEGNADVVKMHELGISNTIAACGTSLTDDHIQLISRATNNLCLMLDGDAAGQAATIRNGKRTVAAGLNVHVLSIPLTPDGKKQDPDSFFISREQFEDFDKQNRKFFLQHLAESELPNCTDPLSKAVRVKSIATLFIKRAESEKMELCDTLAKIIPPKRLWTQSLKELSKQEIAERDKIRYTRVERTEGQNKQVELYGFYEEDSCYHFATSHGEKFQQGSNFVMEPLFHIESPLNAKRLYRLRNVHGYEKVIELSQKDLISIAAFRLRVESLGNFLFNAGDYGLGKIKSYLYDNTKTCKEIVQLGWQKQGFFAWANGITTEKDFIPANELGIVEFRKEFFYLPALSSFYEAEDTLFQFERKFVNYEGNTSLFDLTDLMMEVYADNAIAGVGFYFASLFRDIIVSHFRFFPILNIFGQKGTGKTEMAATLLKFFGDLPVGINMTNSTIPALADHVSRTKNALCHIDEYKNSVEFEKVEFLKALWDGVGRSRMNMEKDKKKEMTAVDSAIILTGQEMTTADNALFSRVLFLSFTKTKFTDDEKERFEKLKSTEKTGLTHITNSLLRFRAKFLSEFIATYNSSLEDILLHVVKSQVEDRILKNWIIPLAAIKIITTKIPLPFTYEKAVSLFAKLIIRQNQEVFAGNEVSDFWNIYQELFSTGLIEQDYDLQIKVVQELKTQNHRYERSINVLFMNPTRVFSLYAQTKKNNNEKKLPKDTLQYYLQNSDEYLGMQQKRFRRPVKNLQEREAARYYTTEGTACEYERPYAWCFDYDKLVERMGLNLVTEFVWNRQSDVNPANPDEDSRKTETPPEENQPVIPPPTKLQFPL